MRRNSLKHSGQMRRLRCQEQLFHCQGWEPSGASAGFVCLFVFNERKFTPHKVKHLFHHSQGHPMPGKQSLGPPCPQPLATSTLPAPSCCLSRIRLSFGNTASHCSGKSPHRKPVKAGIPGGQGLVSCSPLRSWPGFSGLQEPPATWKPWSAVCISLMNKKWENELIIT